MANATSWLGTVAEKDPDALPAAWFLMTSYTLAALPAGMPSCAHVAVMVDGAGPRLSSSTARRPA